MAEEEDPYAVSSDSEDETTSRKPPPKIQIEGRENSDLNKLKTVIENKTALQESRKDAALDDVRKEELEQIKLSRDNKKMKQDFESGSLLNNAAQNEAKIALDEERQRLTEIGKEKYSKFKDKFEKIDSTLEENLEERMKRLEKEMIGLGKETLASAKEKFEKGEGDVTIEKTQVEIERAADIKKVKAAFNRDMTADEAPKDCALCGKIVYPVERIFANKQLYHNTCFKCNKCDKKLTPTNYNSHQGVLLCKVHMLEVFHPEIARNMDPANTEEDEREGNSDDDEEFAVSSKPKHLQGVVKSGPSAVQDELSQIKSLKDKKGDFESSIKESEHVEKRTKIEEEVLQAGRVKAHTEKFVSGAALEGSDVEEDEGDPNIVRGSRKAKREELHFEQIGDIKNKWKTGEVETAEQKEAAERKELESLKGGPSVKERFQERTTDETVVERQWNKDELDTSAAAEARKSFMEGAAYQSTAVEKTATDLSELQFQQLKGFKDRFEKGDDGHEVQKTAVEVDVQLGNIKSAFEKPEAEMTPEERAAQKKKEIEAEFLRFKVARRAAAERARQQEEEGKTAVVTAGDEGADVGSIKSRFDQGEAFKATDDDHDSKQLDVELKMAGKARAKFREIDASGAQPVMPGQQKKAAPSKWDKKDDKPVAEVVNRKVQDEDDEEADEDAFDVKNIMNKFKNIGGQSTSSTVLNSEQKAELEAIKKETKNLKERFEKGTDDSDLAEQRRRDMQEEFERLKREREEAQKRLAEEKALEEESSRTLEKEEVTVKAEHASKMAAKWEKIQAKEAKKAEKSRMPEKKAGGRFLPRASPKCDVCSKSVFIAEQFQCFGILYHLQCFRCSYCRQALRVEKVHRGSEGALFCPIHFKLVEDGKLRTSVKDFEENNNDTIESRSQA